MEPSRGKSLCVPFAHAESSAACVADPESCRQPLTEGLGQHPELCPASIDAGFVRHDKRWSLKQQLMLRRLERKATAGVGLVRPSCLMPSMVGRTEAVDKALDLRHWGVPCDALVSVCGRDAMSWSRAAMALGRPAIVGSTVQQPAKLPGHVRADEQHPWALGPEVDVPTPVGGGGLLGTRACIHLQPHNGVHRRLGRDAERREAPLPDGGPPPVLPPLGVEERLARWA
jgi:hypothetical protein